MLLLLFGLLVATLLLITRGQVSAYHLDFEGRCITDPGDSPPRRVAGLVAPNATALNGELNGGDGSACGCDPAQRLLYNTTQYQENRVCPLNAEPLLAHLRAAGPVTPATLSLKRNHGPIPVLESSEDFRLTIDVSGVLSNTMLVPSVVELTMEDIIQHYTPRVVQTVIACAGNRRTEMNLARCPAPLLDDEDALAAGIVNSPLIVNVTEEQSGGGERVKIVDGVDWGAAALYNTEFTGTYLSEILRELFPSVFVDSSSLDAATIYVEMEGADICKEETEQGSTLGYAAALPLDYVMDEKNEVLLAYFMNGNPLPPEHGAPLRSVVPGQIGARSVKWLVKITLLPQPSNSYFMQKDYKHFGPNTLPRATKPALPAAVFDAAAPITSLNVQLAITSPSDPTTNIVGRNGPLVVIQHSPAEDLQVEGFAFSGGGNAVQAVYVCLLAEADDMHVCDDYNRWMPASMIPPVVPTDPLTETPGTQNWAWSFWEAPVSIPAAGNYTLIARAVDTGNQHMPRDMCPLYSWRGVLNNAWFQLPVTIIIEEDSTTGTEEKEPSTAETDNTTATSNDLTGNATAANDSSSLRSPFKEDSKDDSEENEAEIGASAIRLVSF